MLKAWIKHVLLSEGKIGGTLNFIFSTDEYVLKINQQYLNHNYYTDIITFNYNADDIVSGDIFISIDTVKSNAGLYLVNLYEELYRVMVHGVLHLLGYDDIDEVSSFQMKSKEDFYLKILYSDFVIK